MGAYCVRCRPCTPKPSDVTSSPQDAEGPEPQWEGTNHTSATPSITHVATPNGIHPLRMQSDQLIAHHHKESVMSNFPIHFNPIGTSQDLRRGNDGLRLKTDLRSLADVDGDGVEIGEVVRAIFMMAPGGESVEDESGGGELLYPEVRDEDAEQSAVEVGLRAEMTQLEQKLTRLHAKVKNHASELDEEGGRDTQLFIKEKGALLASIAASVAQDASSSVNDSPEAARLADIAKSASILAERFSEESAKSQGPEAAVLHIL